MNRWWFLWVTMMIGSLASHVYGYIDGLFFMGGQMIAAGIVLVVGDAVHDRRRSRR